MPDRIIDNRSFDMCAWDIDSIGLVFLFGMYRQFRSIHGPAYSHLSGSYRARDRGRVCPILRDGRFISADVSFPDLCTS